MKKRIRYFLFFVAVVIGNLPTLAQTPITSPTTTTIFIHTSKPSYSAGEKIWFSAYLFNNSTGQLFVNKHPLYVQLYESNGNIIDNQIIYTQAGRGSGTLQLLPSASVGVYRLRAFTQNMVLTKQTIFEQQIYVGVKPSTNELTTRIDDSALLEISTDSSSYSKRSPVELFIQSDLMLDATVSVSVYQDSEISPYNNFSLPDKTSEIKGVEPEEQLLYMGHLRRSNGTKIDNGQIILSMNLPNGQKTYFTNTDSTGFFIFKDLIFEGEQTAFWQVNNTKGKPISDAMIQWIKFPSIPSKIDSLPPIKGKINIVQQPAIFIADGDSLNDDSKMLEEVSVKAKKIEKPVYLRAMLHNEKDVSFAINFENNQLPNDASGQNFYMMLKMLPACPPTDPPIYLIDGMKLYANGRPEEMVDLRQIKRIELLKGPNGAIYGSPCVYAIYTYGVEDKTKKVSEPAKTIKLNGYQREKSFYQPNYDKTISLEQDNRQTLYWNPNLVFESNKPEHLIRFFTSDVSGNYRVVVKGMSSAGPVYSEAVFQVK